MLWITCFEQATHNNMFKISWLNKLIKLVGQISHCKQLSATIYQLFAKHPIIFDFLMWELLSFIVTISLRQRELFSILIEFNNLLELLILSIGLSNKVEHTFRINLFKYDLFIASSFNQLLSLIYNKWNINKKIYCLRK